MPMTTNGTIRSNVVKSVIWNIEQPSPFLYVRVERDVFCRPRQGVRKAVLAQNAQLAIVPVLSRFVNNHLILGLGGCLVKWHNAPTCVTRAVQSNTTALRELLV